MRPLLLRPLAAVRAAALRRPVPPQQQQLLGHRCSAPRGWCSATRQRDALEAGGGDGASGPEVVSGAGSSGGRGDEPAARGRPAAQPHAPEPPLAPGLYVVGTPIGNLEDISMRALRVLRGAGVILAEDTRHSRKLLDHFGITTPLLSCHEHNERQRTRAVLQRLAGGEPMALISDAGMPAISDPGAGLVAAAAAAGVPVFPIPGPCAAICGLVGSGLPTSTFLFAGFLPPKQSARRAELRRLSGQAATLVLYAPPHGLLAVLGDAAAVLGGGRRCCVARELTKMHEEFVRGTLSEVLGEFSGRDAVKGEMVLIIEGAPEAQAAVAEAGAAAALAAAGADGGSGGTAGGGGDGDGGEAEGGGEAESSGGAAPAGGAAASAAAAAAGAAAAAAASAAAGDSGAVRRMIAAQLAAGESVSAASRQLAQQLGLGRSQLYKLALQVEAELGRQAQDGGGGGGP
ncbi:MAG: tetrapyrrole methylase [Monoraphidium minutum]|nr:MAG: tetrapyrrole methylase [Monoraphidium minutum]